jgi:hypothetical protein
MLHICRLFIGPDFKPDRTLRRIQRESRDELLTGGDSKRPHSERLFCGYVAAQPSSDKANVNLGTSCCIRGPTTETHTRSTGRVACSVYAGAVADLHPTCRIVRSGSYGDNFARAMTGFNDPIHPGDSG